MSAVDVALNPISKETLRSSGYIYSRSALCPSESIVIYITVSGSLLPIRVMESDSIASVKLRIQTCQGFVVKRQKLVFGGRELSRNDSLVKDYGVTNGNVLHLVLKLSDLLLINVWTTSGEEFEFHVDRHKNIGYLKRRIAKKGRDFVSLEDPELFCNGEKLEDQRLIDDISKNAEAVIHLVVQKSVKLRVEKNIELSIVATNSNRRIDDEDELQVLSSKPPDKNSLLEAIIVNPNLKFPSFVWDMINSASDGLEKGRQPIRSSEGMGGTYFMQDVTGNKYIAIFKPTDEEPMAVNNPHGLPLSANGEGLKRGTRVGEGALREVAAYILDHPRTGPRSLSSGKIGFSGVPPTVMVKCMHRGSIKIGSLQMFKKNFGSCEDIGPQNFPVEEVHKISVFDIRTANADRHAGNILWNKDGGEERRIVLIPIDHGYCLPENFEDCTFDWMYWPQARQPFSSETIEYIKSLDAEQDIALLKLHGWDISPECARILRVSTMLLKKGVEKGLSPFAIGSIMCRETLNKKSVIEEIVGEAEDSMLPGMSEIAFLECMSKIMDNVLGKLVT
ncbi:phosphatidylinositol 4-kinase gamma 4-like [Olea europaea var. sylvestris]|uniref:phosphatidylinositol 4-kinase gamma 4-like n=1 Tax=Olea europaea var. sylvestris TaxID=158386 RepID=UPI000C1D223D|nr:phosphatidylinositol 4-kinase gamma 4-like [Olea europaea var. sylvestris]